MPLNLGDLSFSLGADTTALTGAISKLQQFSSQVDSASKRTSDGADAVAAAMQRQEAAMTSALNKVVTLNATIARSNVNGGAAVINQTTQAYNAYVSAMSRANVSALGFQRANERLNASLTSSRVAFATLNNAANSSGSQKMTQILRDMSAAAVLITGPLGGVASRIGAFGAVASSSSIEVAALVAGVAAGALIFDKLGKAVLDVGVEMKAWQDQLTAVTGSQTTANAALQDAFNIANQSGQSINTVVPEYMKFAAVTTDTGLAGQKAHDIFEGLADIMSKLHAPASQTTAVFNDFQQMVDRVSLTTNQLSRKLDSDLPSAFEQAIKASGLTAAQFDKLLTSGQVVSDTFLPKFIDQLKQFYNVTNTPVDTFEASTNRLHNSWTLMMSDLDNYLGVSSSAKAATESFTAAIDYLRTHSALVETVVLSVLGAIIALIAASVAASIGMEGFAAAVTFLTVNITAMGVAIMENPIGLLATILEKVIIAAIGAASAYALLHSKMQDNKQTAADLNTEITDFITHLYDAKQGMMGIGNVELTKVRTQIAAVTADIANLQVLLAQTAATKFLASEQQPGNGVAANYGMGSAVLGSDTQVNPQYAALQKQLADAQTTYRQAVQNMYDLKAAISDTQDQADRSPLKDLTKDLTQQQDALTKLTDSYNALNAETEALNNGGMNQYDQVKQAADEQAKIDDLRKTFDKLNLTVGTGTLTLEEYTTAMKAHDAALILAKTNAEALKIAQDTLSQSFDAIYGSLQTMAEAGKFSFQTLSSAAATAVADIIKSFNELAVLNPIKNALFGLTGSNALPTLSNLFGGIGSLFGGQAPGAAGAASAAQSIMLKAANGAAFGGGVRFLADGGLLNGPTMFNTSSGIAIGGEAGTEAVMPLSRGADGKLGVKGSISTSGQAGGGTVVYQIDARQGTPGIEQSIIAAIKRVNDSVESRALRAVQNANKRNPKYLNS